MPGDPRDTRWLGNIGERQTRGVTGYPATVDQHQLLRVRQTEQAYHLIAIPAAIHAVVQQQVVPGQKLAAQKNATVGQCFRLRSGEVAELHGGFTLALRPLGLQLALFVRSLQLPEPQCNQGGEEQCSKQRNTPLQIQFQCHHASTPFS